MNKFLWPALAALLMAACTPEPAPSPEPEPEPKPQPKPESKKERTIFGLGIDDYRSALDLAKKYSDTTYTMEFRGDWEIDSVQLRELNLLALADIGQHNLGVQNAHEYGIYAPNNETQYAFDYWKTPGWRIKANPDNDATPFASLVDYPKFIDASQTIVREAAFETVVVDLTPDQANRFSAVLDSVITAAGDDKKMRIDNSGGYPLTITDERTFELVSTPSVNDAKKPIQLDWDMKMLAAYTGKWHVHGGLRTANFAWKSEELGQKTEFRSHQPADGELAGEIVIFGADGNKFNLQRQTITNKQSHYILLTAIETFGDNSVMPDDYIYYYRPDGSKDPRRIFRNINVEDYAFFLPDQEAKRLGIRFSASFDTIDIIRAELNKFGINGINGVFPYGILALISSDLEYFNISPVTRDPASIGQ